MPLLKKRKNLFHLSQVRLVCSCFVLRNSDDFGSCLGFQKNTHPLLIGEYQGPVESMKVRVWSILLGYGVPEVSGIYLLSGMYLSCLSGSLIMSLKIKYNATLRV
jgi:hypothetical protein